MSADVARRLDRSRRIATETLTKRDREWRDAITRIAGSEHYSGLTLRPQLGLVPLGPDPDSGLEEFLDWRTHDWSENDGALPARGESGRIAMTGTRGIVFVLVPGGSFLMGAQPDPAEENFDPAAGPTSAPVRPVVLAPYLISRYEMTQGQWFRATGGNPSQYGAGWFSPNVMSEPVSLAHPVELVSWEDGSKVLDRLAMQLPTEAQWERAARAGADPATIWTATSNRSGLARFANLAGREAQPFFPRFDPEHVDPFVIPAAVGSLAPNAFGLHDTTGNVWEWCRDSFSPYVVDPRPGDGLRPSTERYRILRGVGFDGPADASRLAHRNTDDSSGRTNSLGLRASRPLRLD
ncbi:MAG: formylglycine-generating enzyme family protein [Planctomycetota bacterium]